MREEIRALQQRLGLTVVYVTHDQSEALAVSDKIVVMRNAEIAQSGPPEALYASPENVFVATFMGEANHVRGVIESISGDHARVALDGVLLELPHRGMAPGPVDVVIRPEAIRLADTGPGIAGQVTRATYMGSHSEYLLATPLGELFAILPERLRRRQASSAVFVNFDPEGVVLVRP
jgi:iron(III) transport system ATP-binding protein